MEKNIQISKMWHSFLHSSNNWLLCSVKEKEYHSVKGGDGLDGMNNALKETESILFGFLKVEDEDDATQRLILIKWQVIVEGDK